MKKYAIWAGAAFVIFYLLSQPHNAADVVNGTVGALEDAANSLSKFVNKLGD